MDNSELDCTIDAMGKALLDHKPVRVIAETLAYVRDQPVEAQIDLAVAIFTRLSQAGCLVVHPWVRR